jgi:hypothetical protein
MKNINKELDELLKPTATLIKDITSLKDDILIIGVGGKIGQSLALLCKQAVEASVLQEK